MNGTLTKRLADGSNKLTGITVYAPSGSSDRYDDAELTAKTQIYLNGELMGYSQPKRSDINQISVELPLSRYNDTAFRLVCSYEPKSAQMPTSTDVSYHDDVPMFQIFSPGDLYITDQIRRCGIFEFMKGQGIYDNNYDTSAARSYMSRWSINIPIRAYVDRENHENNKITIYDNGVPIQTFYASIPWQGNGISTKVNLKLTNNLEPGIHVLWASRTMNGETIYTEPVAFSLMGGSAYGQVYVSDLTWKMFNQRLGYNGYDIRYFKDLSELAGETIWAWPGQPNSMNFKVNGATANELEKVFVLCTTSTESSPRRIECELKSNSTAGNISYWGFENRDLGNIESISFEFQFKTPTTETLNYMTDTEKKKMEQETFFKVNGLGKAPNLTELAEQVAQLTNEERQTIITDLSETSQVLSDLKLTSSKTEDGTIQIKMAEHGNDKANELGISDYSFTLTNGGETPTRDIYMEMEKERETGISQKTGEEGWKVMWSEIETEQGPLFVRLATFNDVDPSTGKPAMLTHTTYYMDKAVADALLPENTPTPVLRKANRAAAYTASAASTTPYTETGFKTTFDTVSNIYGYADMGYATLEQVIKAKGLTEVAGKSYGVKQETWKKIAGFGDKTWVKRMDGAMSVLGVIDTTLTIADGYSGKSPNELRALLNNVKDEKARKSLEWQIRDYEDMRESIYQQDCVMSLLNTGSSIDPTYFTKVATFLGGIVNSCLSDGAKEANNQVYNTTLHDIQTQLKYERYIETRATAEQWLRDKMDRIWGKGNWTERTLAEEKKLWLLQEDPTGAVKYVWKQNAPKFSVYIDPSGYVFEAVEEDRIDGVTASVYHSDTIDGNYTLWQDPAREPQSNPQTTGDDGRYSWMVPGGWWKVRYKKDGYMVSESKPMRVPPAHTTVNIGLLSTEEPKASVSQNDGQMTIIFSKYMQLESLVRLYGGESYDANSFDASAFGVKFYDENGYAIPGTVTFPDKQPNTGYTGDGPYGKDVIDSDWFVRTAVFTPTDKTVDLSKSTRSFSDGMQSYSGVALNKDEESTTFYLINFDPSGGSVDTSALATGKNGKLSKLPVPSREGYSFEGWYTAADDGTQVTTETVFTAHGTIYAHWTQNSNDSSGDDSSESGNSNSGGGNVYKPEYSISSNSVKNGKINVSPKSAAKGDDVTVTVTPDKGYKLDNFKVLDQNGNELKLIDNGNGKYTFTMPAGKVEIKAEFSEEAENNPSISLFGDVPVDAYYYDAVKWAQENKITDGIGNGLFGPTQPCTRAQIVAFLWRAAGSPEPKNANSFGDVSAESYYAKAVAWAVENGITSGVGNGKFSPDTTCTRAQVVTFLYRASGTPDVSGNTDFSDVATDAYYATAVKWAEKNSVTEGIGNGLFGTNNSCTRAQIVTFLYRVFAK